VAWWLWLLIGVLALAGESLSMALFLLNVALAAFVVAALVAFAAVAAPLQVGIFVALAILLIGLARPRLLRLLTGREPARPMIDQGLALVDRFATVTDTVTCDNGTIQVGKAEFWTARIASPVERIPVGQRVRVTAVRGLTAYVEPVYLPNPVAPAPIDGPAVDGEEKVAPPAPVSPPSPGFGALLKRHRVAAGLTQEELAEHAKLSVRAISDLERGLHRAPQKDTIGLLAEALALAEQDRTAFAAAARPAGPRHGATGKSVSR